MSWSITSMFDAIIIPWNSVVDIQVYVKESSNLWPGSNNSKLLECFAAASWHGNKLFWAKQPPHQLFSTWSHCINPLPVPPKYFQIKQIYKILVRTLSHTLAKFDAVYMMEPYIVIAIISYVNLQSCLLIIFQYQPICMQYSWLSVEQPVRFRLSIVYASLGISNTKEDARNVNMPKYLHSE